MKINRKKTIFTVLYNKHPCLDYDIIAFKICIFPKGLVHGFGQKIEILLTFHFMQNTPRKRIWRRSR